MCLRLKDIPYPYFIQQKQLDKASNPENDHNKSPAAKEIEDEDTNPRRPPKKSHSIVLSSEDDDDIPASVLSNVQPPKKIQVGPKKGSLSLRKAIKPQVLFSQKRRKS